MNLSTLSLLSFGLGSFGIPLLQGSSDLWVQTAGGYVHGMIDETTPSVRQFLGIPFGQPPVGDLRFAPPQPARPFDKLEATTLPPSCMQYLSTGTSLYTRDVLEFNLQGLSHTGSISEDCLTLSVWTPVGKHESDRLPVLIFIYGGGFATGGQDVPYQLPPQWVQRTQAHVVVSFNYRLNIFGFPNAAGLHEQNPGLHDQRLAVEWVRDNIAAFGGDPTRMVLWGQSAGAMSVAYYNFAHFEDPIVKGLILDSGTEFTGSHQEPQYSNFSFVAKNVGCGGLSPEREMECMRQVPANQIEDFVQSYGDSGTEPAISFSPSVDGQVVFANYTQRAVEGYISKIPAIIGTNAQDGVPFAPYNPSGPNTTIATDAMLSIFFCPSFKSTMNRLAAGVPTFRYEYFGNFTNISPKPWMGAYHSSELPMLFGTHPDFRGNSTPLEYGTSFAMQDAWLAFARDGETGLSSTGWPLYDTIEDGKIRGFGRGVPASIGNTKSLEAQCKLYL